MVCNHCPRLRLFEGEIIIGGNLGASVAVMMIGGFDINGFIEWST